MSANSNVETSPAEPVEVPSTGGSTNAPNNQQQVAPENAHQRTGKPYTRGNNNRIHQDTKLSEEHCV